MLQCTSICSIAAASDKSGPPSALDPGLIDRGNYTLGHTRVFYVTERNKRETMLVLVPESKLAQVLPRRQKIEPGAPDWSSQEFASIPADALVSLAEIHVAGQKTNPLGSGMIEDPDTTSLVWVGQKEVKDGQSDRIETDLRAADGTFALRHTLVSYPNTEALECYLQVTNIGQKTLGLQKLSSFCLGGITPFARDDAPGRLRIHRFHSGWAGEARPQSYGVEEAGLERSWAGFDMRTLRLSSVGSKATLFEFPFVAVEDTGAKVTWGVQLACNSSWQIDLFRKRDGLSISGGLADYEVGHWQKNLSPGESFETPHAWLAVVAGGRDAVCDVLTSAQNRPLDNGPAVEADLPLIFNEYCGSWGHPSRKEILAMCDRLQGTGVKYVAMDAGWYIADLPGAVGTNWIRDLGDWKPNPDLFPGGLKQTCDDIRKRGFIPGLWFEPEAVTAQTAASQHPEAMLRLNGDLVDSDGRTFFDFRLPFTRDWLTKRVTDLVKDCGFGYVKIDYNGRIDLGADGSDSPGEALRSHMAGVLDFYRQMHREIPGLVMEDCASGGSRLDPLTLSQFEMASFSDCHEGREIPVIAANLDHVILPRQNQIWATLHSSDDERKICYSLSSGFLGRLCLSGSVQELSSKQWSYVTRACALYRQVSPILKEGHSHYNQHNGPSWRHLQGYQSVCRLSKNEDQALLVIHTFAKPYPAQIKLPLPPGHWHLEGSLTDDARTPDIQPGQATVPLTADFSGAVFYLRKTD
jgi:alpha-galactosidase